MTATVDTPQVRVPFHQIERELAQLMKSAQGLDEAPVTQARMSNLVIFCPRPEVADHIDAEIPSIVAAHPARVLLLVGDGVEDSEELVASVHVRKQKLDRKEICSEQVALRVPQHRLDRLPFALRSLLIGDLPTNLWWASTQPPPLAGPFVTELAEHAQQFIYDSLGWSEPHRGVAATSRWLHQFERAERCRWRVVSDLNWRRLKYWRRMLGQALDPAAAPGLADSISEVLMEHGPHAVTQAWALMSWLAARLGWQVQAARLQPGIELSWDVKAQERVLRVRIRRLCEGPAELRRVRIAGTSGGQPLALNVTVDEERRLSVIPEGANVAPRTLTFQRQSLAELLAKQLSDREPDPVFRESMAVAQVFAHSILA